MASSQKIRQFLVMAGLTFCCVSDGFIFGQMSGMIDALRSGEDSIQLDDEDISWIASIINVICFCGFVWMTTMTEILGRKKSITIFACPVVICWIMVYLAENKTILLITRVIVGISFGGVILLTYICIGEYVSPNLRPLCLNMISSFGTNAGTMLGHILSIFMHWRHVALVGIIPSALSAIFPLFWVESPSWLASKGQFKECEKAFKLLHEPSLASSKELKSLIAIQKEEESHKISQNTNSLILMIQRFVNVGKTKYFWKLFLLLSIASIYRTVAGKIFFSTFAITILQEITGTSDILSFTLLVDGFMMLGTALACILVKNFNMRCIILKLGTLANVIQVLLAISLFVWQDRKDFVVWIKVALLAFYFIIVNAGPYAVIETLMSELFPLDIKSILMVIIGIICGVAQFVSIKYAPIMIVTIGYHGVFFVNSSIAFVCLFYLYFFLPETKGRTLQEIEYYFKYNTFEPNEHITVKQGEELLNVNCIKDVHDDNKENMD